MSESNIALRYPQIFELQAGLLAKYKHEVEALSKQQSLYVDVTDVIERHFVHVGGEPTVTIGDGWLNIDARIGETQPLQTYIDLAFRLEEMFRKQGYRDREAEPQQPKTTSIYEPCVSWTWYATVHSQFVYVAMRITLPRGGCVDYWVEPIPRTVEQTTYAVHKRGNIST